MAAFWCAISGARADYAVVVGVTDYPGLALGNLAGCVNDAKLIKGTLEKQGFTVELLTNETATKQGIVAALDKAAKINGENERFVLYFAGHGTKNQAGGAVLLPSNALDASEENDLSADLLHQKVRAVPGRSRTVLLDSCFSGGMMRSFQRLTSARRALATRYYVRNLATRGGNSAKDLSVVRANRAYAAENAASEGKVCYFSAARANEQAAETNFDDRRHGIFTYYLCLQLTNANLRWSEVQPVVSAKVSEQMEDLQHPTFSTDFKDTIIFEGLPRIAAGEVTAVKPETSNTGNSTAGIPATVSLPLAQDSNLWADYNADNFDTDKVELKLLPDQTTFKVGDQLRFEAKVGTPGYLIIVERGTSGKVNLLFPVSGDVEAASVKAGQTIAIPGEDEAFAPDASGYERIRALLVTSRDKAAALLARFPKGRGITPRQLARDLITVRTKASVFYSSDVIFEVVSASDAANPANIR